MRGVDFRAMSAAVSEAAGKAAERFLARCEDHQMQHHMIQPRAMVRAKGIEFNRYVWEGDHYGFFMDDKPVAVVKKQDDRLALFLPVEGICDELS